MNILLATHNFLPYHWGGSEIYVFNLAKHLIKAGHKVTIIAAVNGNAFVNHSMIYEDKYFRACSYLHNSIKVIGVEYKLTETGQIYSKSSERHQKSWEICALNSGIFDQIDILHINGFTAVIGLDLISSVKKKSPVVKIITSYHTPISDPKETLTFGNKLIEQPININHLADLLSYRFNVSYKFALALALILPNIKISFLPAIFSLKFHVKKNIEAFNKLVERTQEWWVYSEFIKLRLINYGIPSDQIQIQRHGIPEIFLRKERNNRSKTGLVKFLYSGRLSKSKGIKTLLKSWIMLKETENRVLWITAKPVSANRSIQKWINLSLKRNDIKWLGEIEQKDLELIYRDVQYVIIPSECVEIGPMVFHEAIASSCHVITSDIGGCKELADHFGGSTLFRCGDVKALAKVINEIQAKDQSTPLLNFPTSFTEHFNRIMKSSFYNKAVSSNYRNE